MVAEARSADEPVLTRRCVIMKVLDFTTQKYLEAQRQNAAAVLILLPKNISGVPHDTLQVISHQTLCSRACLQSNEEINDIRHNSEKSF